MTLNSRSRRIPVLTFLKSNTGLGGIFTGLALNPNKISNIFGVVKAYTTRVGGGPFPTEDLGEVGTKLQDIGREFGVTTGQSVPFLR